MCFGDPGVADGLDCGDEAGLVVRPGARAERQELDGVRGDVDVGVGEGEVVELEERVLAQLLQGLCADVGGGEGAAKVLSEQRLHGGVREHGGVPEELVEPLSWRVAAEQRVAGAVGGSVAAAVRQRVAVWGRQGGVRVLRGEVAIWVALGLDEAERQKHLDGLGDDPVGVRGQLRQLRPGDSPQGARADHGLQDHLVVRGEARVVQQRAIAQGLVVSWLRGVGFAAEGDELLQARARGGGAELDDAGPEVVDRLRDVQVLHGEERERVAVVVVQRHGAGEGQLLQGHEELALQGALEAARRRGVVVGDVVQDAIQRVSRLGWRAGCGNGGSGGRLGIVGGFCLDDSGGGGGG